MGVYRSQTSDVMVLGYGILNVAVICDYAWIGEVPVAASVVDSSLTGRSTGNPGKLSVAASSSAWICTDRLVVVAA